MSATVVQTMDDHATPRTVAPLTRLFLGAREVRAFWRLLVYVALVAGLGWVLVKTASWMSLHIGLLHAPGDPAVMSPASMILSETTTLLAVLLAAVVMGRLEWRTLADYGLPARGAFRRDFWAGMLWGLLIVSAVIGGIALFHGYSITGLAISGTNLVGYAAVWLLVFVLVGLFEEFTFRGYTQFTVASGLGFWPAAVLLSAAFGAVHLGNPNEGLIGALQVFFVAMFLCLTLRRTGTLWFAVGVHASFDWGETYLYSVPNSGLHATGHLFASSLHAATWLTGGTVGPEGSVICFVAIAIAIALFAWRYPAGTLARSLDRA